MAQSPIKLPTDTWVAATWDEYIQAIEDPNYVKAKGYYYLSLASMRLQLPIGKECRL
jgi:beta-xylosidase